MNEIIQYKEVENVIVVVRNSKVIMDYDVANIYGVGTKEVNQAVRNNPDKFPEGYVFEVTKDELEFLRSKNLTTNYSPKSRVLPKAFTEKGLYMLATILHSPLATQTTIAIVETFAKVRELSHTVTELSKTKDGETQKSLMERGGEIISELLEPDMEKTEDETEIELNFAVLKFKHSIKRKKK